MEKSFGRWIKARRRSLGLGLWRCASRAYLGGEALRLIETGKSHPAGCKAGTFYGLARVLKLDLEEVITRAAMEDERLIRWLAREWRD